MWSISGSGALLSSADYTLCGEHRGVRFDGRNWNRSQRRRGHHHLVMASPRLHHCCKHSAGGSGAGTAGERHNVCRLTNAAVYNAVSFLSYTNARSSTALIPEDGPLCYAKNTSVQECGEYSYSEVVIELVD